MVGKHGQQATGVLEGAALESSLFCQIPGSRGYGGGDGQGLLKPQSTS